ncbi:amidase [Physcia stellaris]|nr:amidase [Physcia stellaris]
MADPFSTVAAVVSFVDVTVRACKGIYTLVDEWKDAPNAINRARQSAQNLESTLGSLRRYVNEYESSKLFLEQQQLLPDVLDASTASHAEGARYSLSQQVDNLARIQYSNFVQHTTALGLIGTRLKPVSDGNALVMDKLDQMLRLLATKQVDERASKSHSTFQTASIELLTRIVRAELRRVVPPVVEEYLDPYKSNENAQLEGIRKGLDQIVSELGHLSAKEAAYNHERDQKPGSGSSSPELRNDAFVPRHDSLLEGTDFRPSLSTILARGISVEYKSQQGHRGFYERCPMLTTFAIVPDNAEVFRCVNNGDIEALKTLFAAGLAAPTDRKGNMTSLLHDASLYGDTAMCEFLLLEGADLMATDQFGASCMVAAAAGSILSIPHAMTEVTEYYSVLRLLNRYDSDIDMIGSFLLSRFTNIGGAFNVEMWGDIYSEEKSEFKDSSSGSELRSAAGYELKAGLESGKEPEESAPGGPNMIRENDFLNWAQFLCDLGLDLNDMSVFQREDTMFTPLMVNVLLSVSSRSPGNVMAVFLFCILGVDVSMREPVHGAQALHMVFWIEHSVEASPIIKDLAYILIHYGGADPWATTFGGVSPTNIAYHFGWMEDWIIACERCGISKKTLLSKERQRRLESQYLDDGDSTAVDTDDLTPITLEAFETLKKRKPIIGDRLME